MSPPHTQATAEVQALADFNKMLNDDPDRAYYGYPHCRHACDLQAVQTLLVSDQLFRYAAWHGKVLTC